jgi:Fe-S cluster assembly ATP-binding protein
MLHIENLQVMIDAKIILRQIDLEIRPGEVHALLGPNGSGKTSLLMTIMGYPDYRITRGRILFKGVDVSALPIDERARLGIGMSYQRPPTIQGLKMRQLVQICSQGKADPEALAGQLRLGDFLDRDVNAAFSGGEIKRSELLQLMAQRPDLMLFDEPESGVDLDSIALVGETIRALLQREHRSTEAQTMLQIRQDRTKMGLIITHTGHILDYVPTDKGHILCNGTLGCSGNPYEMLQIIRRVGYEECVQCITEN